jgi:hypothetical protein
MTHLQKLLIIGGAIGAVIVAGAQSLLARFTR